MDYFKLKRYGTISRSVRTYRQLHIQIVLFHTFCSSRNAANVCACPTVAEGPRTPHKSPARSRNVGPPAICSSQTLSHCRYRYLTNPFLSAIDTIQTLHGFLTLNCSTVSSLHFISARRQCLCSHFFLCCHTSNISDCNLQPDNEVATCHAYNDV